MQLLTAALEPGDLALILPIVDLDAAQLDLDQIDQGLDDALGQRHCTLLFDRFVDPSLRDIFLKLHEWERPIPTFG